MAGQENNVMRYDLQQVGLEHYYRNEIDFPVVADMDEATLLLASRVISWQRQGSSLLFQVEGQFYQKRFFYRFLDYRATFDQLERTRPLCVKLSFVGGDILRIQLAQGFSVPDRTSGMLVSALQDGAKIEVSEHEGTVAATSDSLRVVVTKDPWNLTVENLAGDVLYTQYTSSRTQEHPVMKYEQCPFGFLYDTKTGNAYAAEQAEIRQGEHFYGFGEKFMGLDKKGQDIDLWNTNCLGCNTNRTYKNIPFFMSNKGYGLFLHTSCAANANMGQHFSKAYSLMTGDDVLDYFLIHGPSFREILSRYTGLTGKAPLPPKWSFGFWISKISYRSQQECEELAARFRQEEIPCDVIHLDTDWYEHNWVCDYRFSKNRFPDAAGMVKALREKGFRITLWQMPYIETSPEHPNPVYQEGYSKGYFATREDGAEDFAHGLIDFTNPEAVEWYKDKLLRPLLEMGVAAIKVDFGESIPPFYHYAGMEGKRMHNLYPLLYNKAVFEVTKEVHGEEEGLIWARSTWAGSQRYPVHWAGDPDVDFHALAATIRAGLSFGLSGFPFWSHDVGGFNAPAIPEVYARWMQVGCFSSHVRAHGFKTREPWDFGEEVQAISKRYLQLRYRLLPYIYAQAETCARESIPMFRALVLDYQDDENVYGIDDQYLFGDSFLVAPILDATNKRRAYLPAGCWTGYWTGEQLDGGRWISIEADLATLPLYVRENAIIPMGPVMDYVDEKPCDPLTLDLYPMAVGSSSFYVNDTCTTVKMEVAQEEARISVTGSVPPCRLRLHGVEESATCNGEKISGLPEKGTVTFAHTAGGALELSVRRKAQTKD